MNKETYGGIEQKYIDVRILDLNIIEETRLLPGQTRQVITSTGYIGIFNWHRGQLLSQIPEDEINDFIVTHGYRVEGYDPAPDPSLNIEVQDWEAYGNNKFLKNNQDKPVTVAVQSQDPIAALLALVPREQLAGLIADRLAADIIAKQAPVTGMTPPVVFEGSDSNGGGEGGGNTTNPDPKTNGELETPVSIKTAKAAEKAATKTAAKTE
jgi:hypothetical protein